jgi:hypothetical protein
MKDYVQRRFHALKKTDRVWLRKSVGVALVIGGILGFLPVLGYWMFPLGLALLSVDSPRARRLYRRLAVWFGRQAQRLRGAFRGPVPARAVRNPKLANRRNARNS